MCRLAWPRRVFLRYRGPVKRGTRSWLLLVAAGVLVAACSTPGTDGSSGSGSAQVLPPNQVQALSEPGVGLSAPVDSGIRGYGFTAQVTGVAKTDSAGAGRSSVDAAPGRHLIVVSLNLTTVNAPDPVGDGSGPAVAADVSIDGSEIAIDPADLINNGQTTYVVSVPDQAKTV